MKKKNLSYDTLQDIREMLIKQIHKEKIFVKLFNLKKDKLSRLYKDINIINKEISKLLEDTYRSS